MKKRIILSICIIILVSVFAVCGVVFGGILAEKPIQEADPWADYKCITVAEALQLCEQFVDACWRK